MIHHKIEQNTPEWHALRLGKFTASMFKDILGSRSNEGFKKAIDRVVWELLTGVPVESYSNEWMQRGHELEPIAIEQYQALKFTNTIDAGFWEFNKWVGASPDQLIGDDGLLEIKCPKWSTMLQYIRRGKVPTVYVPQIQGQLMCTGRQWCDFMAFHPDVKPLIIRVNRDEEMISNIQTKLEFAVKEVKEQLKIVSEYGQIS